MDAFMTVMMALLLVLIALAAVALYYAPDLGRRTLYFGVEIEPTFRSTLAGLKIRRRYRLWNFGGGLVALAAACLLGFTSLGEPLGESSAVAVSMLPLLQVIVASASTNWARRRVQTWVGAGERAQGDKARTKAWKLGGLVYYNPADPAVFIDKRIGFGVTINMARPVAWWFIGIPLFFAAFIIVVELLAT